MHSNEGIEKLEDWPNPSAAGAHRSILSDDLLIEGNLTSSGPIEIYGKIIGKVRASEILLAPSAEIDGEISAFELQVHGTSSGSVTVRQVFLASTAVLRADIAQVRSRLRQVLRSRVAKAQNIIE